MAALLKSYAILAALVVAGAAVAAEPETAEPSATDFVSATVQHGARAADAAHAGIWKAVAPASGTMHGEFDSNDPIGLAAGVRIEADCSINWIDPDSGRRYCFSSATSLVYFLDAPHTFLIRARKRWSTLQSARP